MSIIKRLFGKDESKEKRYETSQIKSYRQESEYWKQKVIHLHKEVDYLRNKIIYLEGTKLPKANNVIESPLKENVEDNKIEHQIKQPDKKIIKEDSLFTAANLEKLQKEYASLQALYDKIGEELTELRNQTDRMKISLSTCQKQYKDEYHEPKSPKEAVIIEYDEENDDVETTPPPIIIPKPLSIKRYEDYEEVVRRNLSAIVFERDNDKDEIKPIYFEGIIPSELYEIAFLANLLKDCGKEILLIKCNQIKKEIYEDNKNIISTCNKICELRTSGDKLGLEKYLSYFLSKYPQPGNPFDNIKPVDFVQDEFISIYNNAFFLLYYLNSYYKSFDKKVFNYLKTKTWDLALQNVEINDGLIKILGILNGLLYYGYRMCIVPILDENILYRPKSAAQDGEIFSLLY